jgi:hypothetical protein
MIRSLIAAAASMAIPFVAAAQVPDGNSANAEVRLDPEDRLPALTGAENDSPAAIRRSALSVVGASDATSVSLTLSQAERVLTRNGERFGSITLKAPLATSGDEGAFLTEQGISNKASAELAYTWIFGDFSFAALAPAGERAIQFRRACDAKARDNPGYQGLIPDSQRTLGQLQQDFIEKTCKPFNNVLKMAKDQQDQLTPEEVAALRAIEKVLDRQDIYILNVAASFGYKKFDYFNLGDFAEQNAQRYPVSISVSWGLNSGKDQPFFGVGYQHKRDYKEADKRVVCPVLAPGASQLECKNAVFDLPKRNVDHTLFALVRTGNMFGRITTKAGNWAPMFELKVGYDFEDKAWGVSAPLYLFLDKDKTFKGGVRVAWQQAGKGETEDKFKAAFFIVKSFDYFGL